MEKQSIVFSSPGFHYQKDIYNEYDFEIALETIKNNVKNIIERPHSSAKV